MGGITSAARAHFVPAGPPGSPGVPVESDRGKVAQFKSEQAFGLMNDALHMKFADVAAHEVPRSVVPDFPGGQPRERLQKLGLGSAKQRRQPNRTRGAIGTFRPSR